MHRRREDGVITVAKPLLYLETSVISYYTARPSRDVVFAGHQAVTIQWWESDLPKFSPCISQVVVDEIAKGDPIAAAKRLATVANMENLDLTLEIRSLSIEYFHEIGLPENARADATHLAVAAWHGVDYLTTWNCRHIASPRVRKIVRQINEAHGLASPAICTPEELLEF
jgi:hypothetical protein